MSGISTDDKKRLDSWEAAQRELRPGETALERLRFLRWIQRSPWHHGGFARNSSGEIVVGAFFPDGKTTEDEWERKAIEMHEAQKPVEIPDKPLERARLKSGTATAAFEVVQVDETVPKFHESPASTEVQRKKTKRAD